MNNYSKSLYEIKSNELNSEIELAVIMSIFIRTELFEIKRAIESLEIQINIKFDLLIHVDGDIKKEVEIYITKYTPKGAIKNYIFSRTNISKGLASSMNNLILNNFSKYRYFARHDSDDYSAKNRLITQIDYLKNNLNIDIVGTAFFSFDSNTKKIVSRSFFPINHSKIAEAFAYSTPIAHATVLFRKSFFLKAGLYHPNHKTLAEDNRLWNSAFYTNCLFANIKDPLYFVSIDPENYKRRSNILQIIVILKIRFRYLFSKKFNIFIFSKTLCEFFLRIFMSILVLLKLKFIYKYLLDLYQKIR